jgi:hypothetical protein
MNMSDKEKRLKPCGKLLGKNVVKSGKMWKQIYIFTRKITINPLL